MSATKQRKPPVRKRRVPRRGFKLRADGKIRAEDHFCGAGGTTTGVLSVEGWMVVHAANHDPTSILTHSTNYPMVEHSCADIPTMNPAGCPEADVLFTSPECFPAGTLILTARGLVAVEDVAVGDQVLTHMGRWRPVTDTMCSVGDTVLVRGHGHPGIECTAGHPFWTRQATQECVARQWVRRVLEPQWTAAADLSPFGKAAHGPFAAGDMWATPTTVPALGIPDLDAATGRAAARNAGGPGADFDEPLFWWIVGRWLGDGSVRIRASGNEIVICCGKHEADDLEQRLAATLPPGEARAVGAQIRWRRRDVRTATLFEAGHHYLVEWLVEQFGRGARAKTIPAWALGMPEANRVALLDGYLSADGTTDGVETRCSTVSRSLALGIRLLAEGLGHRVGMRRNDKPTCVIEGRHVDARPVWTLSWREAPERHWAVGPQEPWDKHSWARISTVAAERSAIPVYNLSVAEDESYVADGVVVHNCKARSYAVGKQKDDPSLFDPKGDKTAERSRATMDEVTRFAAELQYLYVVVENVPQLISWCEPSETGHWPRIVKGKEVKCNCGATYRRWLRDMENVGYRRHRALFLNSQVFPPTPQSRDRVYVVLALDGVPFPDLNHECLARCDEHGIVMAGQKPKAHLRQPEPVRKAWGELDDVWGRLDQQYFYACPECGQRAEPAITPAATAIEWWRDPGPKIGEREEHGLPPLKDGTVERVGRGIIRLPGRPMVVPLAYLSDPGGPRPRGVDEALRTLTSQQLEALVVAVGGNLSERAGQTRAWSTAEVLRTLTGTLDRGLIVAGRENAVPKGVDSAAMPTATTINSLYQLEFPDLAQIVQAGGPTGAGRNPRDVLREMPAILADNHGALVGTNNTNNIPRAAGSEVMGTATTGERLFVTEPDDDAMVGVNRQHTNPVPVDARAIPTVIAGGEQHFLLVPAGGSNAKRGRRAGNGGRDAARETMTTQIATETTGLVVANNGGPASKPSAQGHARDVHSEVMGTQTGGGQHAIVTTRGGKGSARGVDGEATFATVDQRTLADVMPLVMASTFRMLEPSEIARGMVMIRNAFGEPYIIHGARRKKVRQLGNAVTPPVAAWIAGRIRDALQGA